MGSFNLVGLDNTPTPHEKFSEVNLLMRYLNRYMEFLHGERHKGVMSKQNQSKKGKCQFLIDDTSILNQFLCILKVF